VHGLGRSPGNPRRGKGGEAGRGMRIAMCKAMVMQQRMCTGKTREGWRWVPEEVLGE